jgi:hypothetical protein
MRTYRREQALVWGEHRHHCSAKMMKCSKSLAKSQGQGSMITKTQGVLLVRVMDTPVVLSHSEWTRDKHDKDCVQEGLTSR